jgi:hypothetical protein
LYTKGTSIQVLTMEKILTQLREKAKIECEDELRQVVAEPE